MSNSGKGPLKSRWYGKSRHSISISKDNCNFQITSKSEYDTFNLYFPQGMYHIKSILVSSKNLNFR